MWHWLESVGKFIAGIILPILLGGGVLFGYICFRARAYKWGAGCSTVAALALVGLYLLFDKALLSGILVLILAGGAVAALLCFRDKAYKWGTLGTAVAVLALVGLYLNLL